MKWECIDTGIETITPAIALNYLATNIEHQRNVTHSHVTHLRQQMECGQWMMTGEPIIFDELGRLIDGQHRLRALVAAKKSIEFMVVRGIPHESFMAMNRGKSRTSGNVFSIHGVKNANNVAACVSGVLNYRRAMSVKGDGGGYGSLNTYIRASTSSMVAEYDLHKDKYQEAVQIAALCKKVVKPSVPSVVAAISMIDARHSVEKVAHFWGCVGSGANLSDGSPMLYLRNRFMENASSKRKMPSSIMMTLAIKAWNLYVTNQSRTLIRVKTETRDRDNKIIHGEGCPRVL